MDSTTHTLERFTDDGELIERIELRLEGEVTLAPANRTGHPDSRHQDESTVELHRAVRTDTGEDILGQLDAHHAELQDALFQSVLADESERRRGVA